MAAITTIRVATGTFDVLKDGKPTGWQIVNGSNGVTGRDSRNHYGIVSPSGKATWIGSIASCKRLIKDRLG